MRVTLTLDDDLHAKLKSIARRESRTMGEVLTEIVRSEFEKERRAIGLASLAELATYYRSLPTR